MLCTVLFGLVPALRATRIELVRTMKGEVTREARPGRGRQTLIALQVGAAALLLIASTVFLRSAFEATTANFGLRTSDTLIVPIAHEPLRAAMLDHVASLPSVAAVAAAWPWPSGPAAPARAQTIGPAVVGPQLKASTQTKITTIGYDFASSEYFKVLGIDILKGRAFASDEGADAGVVVVSERGARRLWPGGDAIGQVVQLEGAAPPTPQRPAAARAPSRPYTVVGIVKDIGTETSLRGGLVVLDNPDVYLPIALRAPGTSLVLRAYGDPDDARLALLDRLVAVDPAVGEIRTLRTMLRGQAFLFWVAFWATVLLAGLALTLTASGLFSVLSFAVEQRRKEIGVRMALGATTRNIARWVLSQTFWPVGVGILAGAGLVTAIVKMLTGWLPFLLGGVVRIFDPVMYGVSLLVILAACVLAASLPAWRAARIDPIETLRQD